MSDFALCGAPVIHNSYAACVCLLGGSKSLHVYDMKVTTIISFDYVMHFKHDCDFGT